LGEKMLDKDQLVLQNSTILLIDDDINLRNSFKRILELYVKKVIVANDGIEGLYKFENSTPDIIITDIKMPKMNGLKFIKKVREKDQDIPIIVQSAYTDQEFLLESIKLSLVEYIIKPIKENQLEDVLQACAKHLQDSKLKTIYISKDIIYNYEDKSLIDSGRLITLTNKEIEFIEILLAHKGHLVTKEYLESHIYIYSEAPPSALKNLVFKLRKKLDSELVKTVGKLGYTIE
jgi:DNA-binding response OmpR family regulator